MMMDFYNMNNHLNHIKNNTKFLINSQYGNLTQIQKNDYLSEYNIYKRFKYLFDKLNDNNNYIMIDNNIYDKNKKIFYIKNNVMFIDDKSYTISEIESCNIKTLSKNDVLKIKLKIIENKN